MLNMIDPIGRVKILTMFQYKVIEVPGIMAIKNVKELQKAQKSYQNLINEYAADGWELDKIDNLITQESPGCLLALFGVKPVERKHKLLIYKKKQ